MSQKYFVVLLAIIIPSLGFSDPAEAITQLVGRNAEGYLAPLGTMMGTGMNSGFYRKASPHKILGFDITMDLAYSMAPPGKTTYNFLVPDENIGFTIPFQFPKGLLLVDTSYLGSIPGAGTDPYDPSPESLYKDQEISFDLSLIDLLDSPTGPAQNILGTPEEETLTVTYDSAAVRIYDQVIANTWEQIKGIEGIGKPLNVQGYGQIPAAYTDSLQFSSEFGNEIREAILSGMSTLPALSLPIPGGFGDSFKALPIDIGFPTPILQASIGLPFHTEITARGLPVAMPIGIGTVKYGGFGGKIGISDYLSDILYKPEKDLTELSDSNLVYIIETPPSRINPSDVDNAISSLRLNEINVNAIDSLNYLFLQGNKAVIVEIQSHVRDAQLQLENQPKKKKKKKKFPIDLSLGYYTNDLELDFSGATINSTNRMISLQAGKTLNLPSFLSFLGGVGIYGGIGFESSDLNLGYELANPLAYGCFTDATNDNYNAEISNENSCTEIYGASGWHSGVPIDISLSFPGDNTFRSLIGARMRILLVDAYVDYNMGNSNNSINFGVGFTIR